MAKFLLADDEPQVKLLVEFKLKKEGHTLDYAENGEKAIEFLDNNDNKYDVIILDVMMPVYDGLYVLKHLRKIEDYKDTPVVMLTAKSQEKDIVQGFDLGASEYITKPFSPSEFYARISKYL